MKYIRTKDEIIDIELELSKKKEQYNSYDRDTYTKIASFKLIKKDDILVAVPLDENGETINIKKMRWNNFFSIYLEDIIKQADTIEELCDYLIVFDNDNKISDIVKISDRPKDLIENKLFVEHLFGSNYTLAIETDKGLIYVAKMNDKGELELL